MSRPTMTGEVTARQPAKPLSLAPVAISTRALPAGGMVLRSRHALLPYPRCLGELLRHWAAVAPDRTFLAERQARGGWRRLGDARGVAGRRAARRRPAGAPTGPPPPAGDPLGQWHRQRPAAAGRHARRHPGGADLARLSLLSADHAKLRSILEMTRPGLVFAGDGMTYAPALAAVREALPGGVELAVSANPAQGLPATGFDELLAHPPGRAVAARFAAVGPDTVAKILFTSGSTGEPKGVINTQRMLCSNQQSASPQLWPFLAERPPVIVDWLPWSHTFGGNHNFNMMLRNGGTLYIDERQAGAGADRAHGRATCARSRRRSISTCRAAMRRCCSTISSGRGAARRASSRDLDLLFYAAAALPQTLWERLEALALAARGAQGADASRPGARPRRRRLATMVHYPIDRAGNHRRARARAPR